MGLTKNSVGTKCFDNGINTKKSSVDLTVALAGNPNVGKSTVFNALTGMHQHTGNWPGKTVASAQGEFTYKNLRFRLVDIPGCYSLFSHSTEEEIARDFICFGGADRTVIVCDATCLERNLALVMQTIEITGNCIVCINLADQAKLLNIQIDTKKLEEILGVRVLSISARNGSGLKELKGAISSPLKTSRYQIPYPETIETAVSMLTPHITSICQKYNINPRWLALRLAEDEKEMIDYLKKRLGLFIDAPELKIKLKEVKDYLQINGIDGRKFADIVVTETLKKAKEIAEQTVTNGATNRTDIERKADRILTGKYTAFPIMIIMLGICFYITISGANIPSSWLNKNLFALEKILYDGAASLGLPLLICEALFHGVFRTLSWVIAVMLPPMAIFFPLFTLLEDSGILPRIAFNLDRAFSGCKACGKQSLTMCMGFGCNAAGIVGCRIIDSPRERIIAMLTNVFVPCNGRFPGMISMIAMFLICGSSIASNILSALVLTAFILLGIVLTLITSKLLSETVLKGTASSFTLELPRFRRPQFLQVLVRSVFDRTLFVLSRAIVVAAPAGLIIWVCANVSVDGATLLHHLNSFVDPFAKFFGLDGVILIAFILGFPANEIVIPIMLMSYMTGGTLTDISDLSVMRTILINNGWTVLTAVNFITFSLIHFPCSTTVITIHKESGSAKWTLLSVLLPTAIGLLFCLLNTLVFSLLGI